MVNKEYLLIWLGLEERQERKQGHIKQAEFLLKSISYIKNVEKETAKQIFDDIRDGLGELDILQYNDRKYLKWLQVIVVLKEVKQKYGVKELNQEAKDGK